MDAVIAAPMAADPDRRTELDRRLRAEGWSTGDGLDGLLQDPAEGVRQLPRAGRNPSADGGGSTASHRL